MHGESPIKRRESRKIWVGNVPVGGDAPIAVQSMTNSDTNDVAATVAQINRLEAAGVDIVRVSVPDMDAAEAFGKIKQLVKVPLVADIHFDYRIALRVAELGVDCLRINPGNIGREDRVRAVVDAARDRGIPIRIGVNAGSLEKDLQKKYGEPTPAALVESALRHVEHLERLNFQDFKVSVKASDVFMAVDAYRLEIADDSRQAALAASYMSGYRVAALLATAGALFFAEGFGSTGFNYKHSAWTGTYVLFGALMIPALLTSLFMREPPVPLRTQLQAGRYSFAHQLASVFVLIVLGALPTWLLLFVVRRRQAMKADGTIEPRKAQHLFDEARRAVEAGEGLRERVIALVGVGAEHRHLRLHARGRERRA